MDIRKILYLAGILGSSDNGKKKKDKKDSESKIEELSKKMSKTSGSSY